MVLLCKLETHCNLTCTFELNDLRNGAHCVSDIEMPVSAFSDVTVYAKNPLAIGFCPLLSRNDSWNLVLNINLIRLGEITNAAHIFPEHFLFINSFLQYCFLFLLTSRAKNAWKKSKIIVKSNLSENIYHWNYYFNKPRETFNNTVKYFFKVNFWPFAKSSPEGAHWHQAKTQRKNTVNNTYWIKCAPKLENHN